MKRKYLVGGVLCLLVVLFFPFTNSFTISGSGTVMTTGKEEVGSCQLEIRVREVSSLIVDYRKSFAFTLDGGAYTEFKSAAHAKADGLCSISQMYYDAQHDHMALCTLVYQENRSFAALQMDDNLYVISRSPLPADEIPISIGPN